MVAWNATRPRLRPTARGRAGPLVHEPGEHLAVALDGLGAGLAVGAGDAFALGGGELALELDAGLGEAEQALAAVAGARRCSTNPSRTSCRALVRGSAW